MFDQAIAQGVRFLLVEPINEMTGYDFPAHAVVILSDDNPGAFQNLSKILGAADHIILCELPVIPEDKLLTAAAADGRTVLITCAAGSYREWFAHCQPFHDRLLAVGTENPRRALN